MNTSEYLAAVDERLAAIAHLLIASSVRREVDANLGIGFIQGRLSFIDGSSLTFSEQLPTRRGKYRLHHMDARQQLITRWDSAPHYPELPSFPYHKHTPNGVEASEPVTLLEILNEVVAHLLI
jgi:hypothetical protein